eukprot:TRINITY_DN1951_c0_g4_i1.p1 TRINITY_DN1951_c0_g4~~TRINITY_DN1951_c0_g4_i1.p1  ORF type:complete len:333 (+),score=99.44 TRINITY_DN1951_c0_g4_i1:201-1199(+)
MQEQTLMETLPSQLNPQLQSQLQSHQLQQLQQLQQQQQLQMQQQLQQQQHQLQQQQQQQLQQHQLQHQQLQQQLHQQLQSQMPMMMNGQIPLIPLPLPNDAQMMENPPPTTSGNPKEACAHGQKSYCCWGRLSPLEKVKITDEWRKMDKKERLHRINLCIKPAETIKKRSEAPQKKRFQSKYYVRPPRLLAEEKDEWRCCRQTFSYLTDESLRTVDRQAAIVATSGDLLKPRNHGGLRKPCCQNSTEPVSEETWQELERWIHEKVPRHQTQEDGMTVWIVGDPDDQARLCHRTLLAQFNDQRRVEGKTEVKLWMWKRAWYDRLQLKGKWRFK